MRDTKLPLQKYDGIKWFILEFTGTNFLGTFLGFSQNTIYNSINGII